MNINELKQLIKEIILEAAPKLKSDEELKAAILEFKKIQKNIQQLEEKNKNIFDQLKQYKSSEKSTISDIQKYMIRFNKSMIIADNWVASLQEELKYSEPSKGISYKELYLNLKEKINGVMKAQEEALYNAQLDAARLAKEVKVKISGVNEAKSSNIISLLFNKLKSIYSKFFQNTLKFEKIIHNLPKI